MTENQYFLYERKVFGWELQQYTEWMLFDTVIKASGKIPGNGFALRNYLQKFNLTCYINFLTQHRPFRGIFLTT